MKTCTQCHVCTTIHNVHTVPLHNSVSVYVDASCLVNESCTHMTHYSTRVFGCYVMCVHVNRLLCNMSFIGVHTQCHALFHNSLQFSSWGQIHTDPSGTSSLGGYQLQLPSEGMSNQTHPPQTSCLQRGATGTWHTQRTHQRQHGEGQWLNPVYMVSVMSGML